MDVRIFGAALSHSIAAWENEYGKRMSHGALPSQEVDILVHNSD